MNRYDKQQLGEAGVIYINSTTLFGGLDVWKITVLADAEFDSLLNSLASGDGIPESGVIVKAGVNLYGKFTSIQLLSGAVAAYKSEKL